MKKTRIIFGLLILAIMVLGCATTKTTVPAPEARNLGIGVMHVYDYGNLKFHAYESRSPMGDIVFLLETRNEIILIEPVPFNANIEELNRYIATLGKPLNSVIISHHPFGSNNFIGKKIYAPEGAGNDPRMAGYAQRFGDIFNPSMPVNFDVIRQGTITIGGIRFNFIPADGAFDIEIPAINAYYTHMVGSNTHNILTSVAQIDAMIAKMKDFQAKNYGLILSSHDIPRTIDVAAEKIAYLERTKTLVASNNNAEAFTQAMKVAFPNYGGDNFLGMSARAFFPN